MNKMLIAGTLALLVGCADLAASAAPSSGATAEARVSAGARSDVDIAEFATRHAAGVTVIDVRTPEEYASGHVPGATLVPLDTLDPAASPLAEHPKDEPLYLVCHSGARSSRAADSLAKAGYTVVNVKGGTSGWISAGHPVDK